MDAVDYASEIEQLPVLAAIARARAATPSLPACGTCHNCAATTPPGVLYCDADCRDDHQHRQGRQ